jgi:hypothetical protein
VADLTLVVADENVDVVVRILHRSIALDTTEIRRLTFLGSAYHDRPAGQNVDSELTAARRQRDVAQELLGQLVP